MITFEDLGECRAYESISPADTATGFTPSNYNKALTEGIMRVAKAVLIMVEDQTVTITLHGTDPTAAAGTNLGMKVGDSISYVIRGISNIKNFRCIDTVSGNLGTVKALFFF